MGEKEHKLAEISNAEVLFLGYLAVSDFNGNYKKAHYYGMGMKLVRKIEYSRFIRQLNKLESVIEELLLLNLVKLSKLSLLVAFLLN